MGYQSSYIVSLSAKYI